MKKIVNELAKTAKKNEICEDWYNKLKVTNDIGELIEMYLKGIDFCLANDYPSNDFIRANFKGKMESSGIHLDEEFDEMNSRVVVALGKCSCRVEVDKYTVSEMFIKHDSELILRAKDNAFIMIDMFDSSRLSIVAQDNARVVVNHYGGKIIHSHYGDATIKIREKNKKTY